jgi:hypothetical protein
MATGMSFDSASLRSGRTVRAPRTGAVLGDGFMGKLWSVAGRRDIRTGEALPPPSLPLQAGGGAKSVLRVA